ncbi:RING-type domain-containing protein [Mycena venus]|uniref:RING-type E3 ubiquitin transferase n=1 Tax=Mycena venus TaxID=2733690 RepID=A0A8H6YJ31_9AGAR|nr:RING-type domain-containing protein [Mycena venus]
MPRLQQFFRERAQAFTSSIGSHRILLYALFSSFALAAAIANAVRNYSNFYSVAIFLSKSSRSVLILANFSFLVALLAAHIVQKIFFGALRPSEIERLYDRLWFFITESLLAFTIFRDEFDTTFVVMFGFLLFVKSFHWIAGDRIEWMDQRPYPGPSLLFHVRMTALFLILWVTDLLLFMIAVDSTLANGISGMVLFASEYGILMATVANTVSKYLLCTYELRRAGQRGGENAPQWENKSMWVFYIELATDFLKLTTYLVFFIIIMTFYGIPLNILRDVYVTGRSLITRLRSLHRYQTATRNMDQRYPNATEEEMAAMSDHTCIICREEMVLPRLPEDPAVPPAAADGPNTTPKKLPCGHIFHFNCLRSWLERQQSCPTCRRNVLEDTPRPAGVAPQPQIPGAAPQVPNAGGNQNPFANNPLGLVGRLFAPPGQPGQPGQPAAGQPQNNNLAPNPPNNGAGQPIVIEYHFQYQVPRQQGQPPLQPAPQFQGFPGPNGVWQPWPHAGQGLPNDLPPPAPAPEATIQPVREVRPEAPAPTPTTEPSAPQTGSDAREAAALAALRRHNSGRPADSQTQTATSAATPSPSQPAESAPQPSASGSRPTSSAAPNRRLDVPQLIPMYDYTTAFGPNPNMPSPFAPQTRPPMTGARTSSSQTLPPTTHSGNFRARPSTRGPPPDHRYQQRPPLSQLPPTLTDEQLALMDTVTREAIDERLRVLEGVSGAVYRCIDDLMRMRSALPISTPATGPVAGPSTNVAPPPGASNMSTSEPTADDIAAPAVPIPASPATETPPPEA